MTVRLNELILCALEQGYGLDLRPFYKTPQIPLLTYLKLRRISEDG